jgi:hypothetical protein
MSSLVEHSCLHGAGCYPFRDLASSGGLPPIIGRRVRRYRAAPGPKKRLLPFNLTVLWFHRRPRLRIAYSRGDWPLTANPRTFYVSQSLQAAAMESDRRRLSGRATIRRTADSDDVGRANKHFAEGSRTRHETLPQWTAAFRNRYFATARLPRFSGPCPSWADRSSRRVTRAVAGPPTDRDCKAAIQRAATHRRIRRRDQGHAGGDESASRNLKLMTVISLPGSGFELGAVPALFICDSAEADFVVTGPAR